MITFSSYGSSGEGYQCLDETKGRYMKTLQLVSPEQRTPLVAVLVPELSGLQAAVSSIDIYRPIR
jgi:hypothetical protein